jgi:hypothetical protein
MGGDMPQHQGGAPYEKPGPAKGEAFGIAAVTRALEGLVFPASKRDLLAKLKGHEQIHWTRDRSVDLRQLIQDVDEDRFESMADLVSLISTEARQDDTTEDRGAVRGDDKRGRDRS